VDRPAMPEPTTTTSATSYAVTERPVTGPP
jgi:hypothetical protein